MMRICARLLAVAATVCGTLLAGQADAQRWGNNNSFYHSSTAAESGMRGMSDLVRSRGQAAYDASEAAINLTQARSAQIDNQYKWTQTYFAMRQENRAGRAALTSPRPTEEQLIRFAQAGRPKQLSSTDLSPIDGAVAWPRELTRDTFAEERETLDPIFARRAASNGVVSNEDYDKIQETLADMKIKLKDNIKDMTSAHYIASKRFLESLAYEARL